MRDRLNQFVDNHNGQFIEVSYKDALYQCMDLAYAWVFCLNFPKATIQHQYAYQVFTEPNDLTREYFEIIPNTPEGIPQDGDLVVLKGGTAGHIAIALSGGTTDKFMDFEQNNPLGTNAHLQERNYTNVLGWLRPKIKEPAPVITDQTKIDLGNLGVLEVQAIKSVMRDQNRIIADLSISAASLNTKITALEGKLAESTTLIQNARQGGISEAKTEITKIIQGKGWFWVKYAKIKEYVAA